MECFGCGKELDRFAGATAESIIPSPSNISMCFHCGNIAIFTNEKLEIRKATKEELKRIMKNPTIQKIRSNVLKLKKELDEKATTHRVVILRRRS